MKNLTRTICLTLAVLLGSVGTSWGADYDKGYSAYHAAVESGDLATALREWRHLAEQGDADAQYYLGLMYRDGFGVLQDNVYALMWVNIAISSGFDFATKRRYQLKAKMTPADISAAQELAQECVRKKYKGC